MCYRDVFPAALPHVPPMHACLSATAVSSPIVCALCCRFSLNPLRCRFNPYIQNPTATGNPPLSALPSAPSDTNPAKTQQQPQHQPPALSWVPLVPTTSDFYRVSERAEQSLHSSQLASL